MEDSQRTSWLFLLVLLFGIGLYSFAAGFFLTRVELPVSSSCDDLGLVTFKGCWLPKPARFSKLILMVIDGWRYDFAAQTEGAVPSTKYTNKMWRLQRILTECPSSAAGASPCSASLRKFTADAPTVTMQRLKGILTGSLPTFVDVSSNFAAGVLLEDNILTQLRRRDQQVAHSQQPDRVFVGDDTWLGLFPDLFTHAYPYPSFDVMDLHTVDDGVIQRLKPTITNHSIAWSLIVAHFLGVDHVGHKYNTPDHADMASKLEQMDTEVDAVVHALRNHSDTLLVVMGDHGMTSSGAHGGSSPDEVTAALFMYASTPDLFSDMVTPDVDQVNLAPTLSLLLGLPIPFASIGGVMQSINYFPGEYPPESTCSQFRRAATLLLNAEQVERYLLAYGRATGSFSTVELAALLEQKAHAHLQHSLALHSFRNHTSTQADPLRTYLRHLGHAQSNGTRPVADLLLETDALCELQSAGSTFESLVLPSRELVRLYTSFLDSAKILARERWTQYDEYGMIVGLVYMSVAVTGSITLGVFPASAKHCTLSVSKFATTVTMALILWLFASPFDALSVVPRMLPFTLGCSATQNLAGCALAALNGFTNDFVLLRRVPLRLMDIFAGIALIQSVWCAIISLLQSPDLRKVIRYDFVAVLTLLLIIMRCDALFSNSFIASESAVMFFLSSAITTLVTASLSRSAYMANEPTLAKCFIAVGACMLVLLRCTVSSFGWLWPVPDAPPVSDMIGIVETGTGASSIRWQIEGVDLNAHSLLTWMLFVLPASLAVVQYALLEKFSKMTVFMHVVSNFIVSSYWLQLLPGEANLLPKCVYGVSMIVLGVRTCFPRWTVLSGHVWMWLLPSLQLVGGPMSYIPLHLCMAHSWMLEWMHRQTHKLEKTPVSRILSTKHQLMFCWAWTTSHYYFATGHGNQFNSLQFAAPFVGFDAYNSWSSPVLLILNTFSAHVLLLGVASPMAACMIVDRWQQAVIGLLPWMLGALCSSICGLVMRRHLMVWAVFAPKFVFEVAGFIMAAVLLFARAVYVPNGQYKSHTE